MLSNTANQAFIVFGEPIRWYRYLGRCPCHNPTTGQHDVRHELCGGSGFLHELQPPLPACTPNALALITDYNARRVNTLRGELTEGDLMCSTWRDTYPLAEQDIIVIPSRVVTATETIVRGDGPTDRLREYEPVNVTRMTAKHGTEASGFHLAGRDIVWDEERVPMGERYTVIYTHHPRWVVAHGTVLIRRPDPFLGVELPQRVGLKLMNPSVLDEGGMG